MAINSFSGAEVSFLGFSQIAEKKVFEKKSKEKFIEKSKDES